MSLHEVKLTSLDIIILRGAIRRVIVLDEKIRDRASIEMDNDEVDRRNISIEHLTRIFNTLPR